MEEHILSWSFVLSATLPQLWTPVLLLLLVSVAGSSFDWWHFSCLQWEVLAFDEAALLLSVLDQREKSFSSDTPPYLNVQV